MRLHIESSFENDICQHLGDHGCFYTEIDAELKVVNDRILTMIGGLTQ